MGVAYEAEDTKLHCNGTTHVLEVAS